MTGAIQFEVSKAWQLGAHFSCPVEPGMMCPHVFPLRFSPSQTSPMAVLTWPLPHHGTHSVRSYIHESLHETWPLEYTFGNSRLHSVLLFLNREPSQTSLLSSFWLPHVGTSDFSTQSFVSSTQLLHFKYPAEYRSGFHAAQESTPLINSDPSHSSPLSICSFPHRGGMVQAL